MQDALGRYRAEESWPPADVVLRESALRQGTYADDGKNRGTGSGGGNGLWTFSQPLAHDAWLAGEPIVEATVDSGPRANLAANVYDVAPDGKATMISRGTMLLRLPGVKQARIEMYGQDWPLGAGHRVGVLLSSANSDWWTHVPTQSTVTVQSATVSLPFLSYRRDEFLAGEPTSRLESYLRSAPFNVSAETIAGAEGEFDLPPALTDAPPEDGLKRVEARLGGFTCESRRLGVPDHQGRGRGCAVPDHGRLGRRLARARAAHVCARHDREVPDLRALGQLSRPGLRRCARRLAGPVQPRVGPLLTRHGPPNCGRSANTFATYRSVSGKKPCSWTEARPW